MEYASKVVSLLGSERKHVTMWYLLHPWNHFRRYLKKSASLDFHMHFFTN